jgi:hypothetical protein
MDRPETVAHLTELLHDGQYLADRGLATALFVALSLNRPILLEGEVGVGKTEVAKACKNMKDISFDGMAEPGSDLRQAWRERLQREGKLNTSGGSIRDLVLGADAPR